MLTLSALVKAFLTIASGRGAQPGRRRISISLGAATALTAFGLFAAPLTAAAAAIPCTTADLITAISAANVAGGTVTLAPGCVYTLTAANNTTDGGTGLPVITRNVTVVGSGATITRSTAAGTPSFRMFDVASSGKLTLDSLSLTNGIANDGRSGGGAINSHGTLVVSATTFSGNSSPSTTGTSGGAINSSGQLTVTTSFFTNNLAQEGGGIFNQKSATITKTTFLNNTATIYGGGALLNAFGTMTASTSTFVGNTGPGGGAIDNDATLIIKNSTFYNNTGGSNGGGALQNFGSTSISYSTLSGNTSQYGANIHNYGSFTVSLTTSIVANGINGSNCGGPPVIDNGYNLDTGSSCGFSSTKHSMSNTQPQLEALASNGGPTQTMALPATSPAVNTIPASVSGCTGGTDQRGVARPQGPACDMGSFEVIQSSGDTQPPTVPTNLTASSVTSNNVSLQWTASTDNVGVTGYTVYRNGAAVGSTGAGGVTTYNDATAAPTTAYQYTVDAFDGAGNHSSQSAPLAVTTPAPSGIQGAQGQAVSTSTRVTSTTIPLTGAVHAGDLLVGWFGQFDAAGQVQVSDNINGAWIRSSSTTFSSGAGDIALYYVQNAAASPTGVTVTIAAATATYLEGAASDYSGVSTVGALDQVVVATGVGTAVDSGASGSVGAGELVVGGIITGGSPGTTTPGASQGQTFTMRAITVSGSAGLEDILSSAAGVQDARATLTTSTDWYAVAAVYHQFGSGDTQPPTVPTALTATSVTATSVALSWTGSTDNVAVAGYTVYRNGSAVGTTASTSYTDSTVAGSTTYSYAVDAFDVAANHSAKSSPISVTTPAAPPPSAQWVQGGVVGTGSKVASVTLTLSSPVPAGDLLVGWFGQFDSTGQVLVSDNVNGAWTRSAASTKFGSAGDIALYYVQNAAAAPAGVTITISTAAATYLQASAAEYSNVAVSNSLDQFAVASGTGTTADSGTTATVGAGELLFSGFMSGTSPGGVVANGGLVIHDRNGSGSLADASMIVTASGPQHAGWTLSTSADWYEVAAVFQTTAAIFPPSNLTAAAAGSTQVNLAWSSGGGAASTYTVYRNGSVLASVPGASTVYSDTTVLPSTSYTYAVDAVGSGGNHSAPSNTASVTTPADTTPPTAPAGLTAAPSSLTQISLSWTGSTDNVGVTGYTIYRNAAKVGTTGATTLTYTDSGLAPATSYTYTVDAFDAAGNHSALSASATAATSADTTPPTVPAGVTAQVGPVGEVDVQWSASTDDVGVAGYTVYRGGVLLATVSSSTLTYADKAVASITAYSYTVDAFDAAGNHSAQSAAATVTTPDWVPPSVPAGLAATVVSSGEIDLAWNASSDNVAVTGYTVYRNGVSIGTTAGGTLTYADTTVGHGFTYSYAVDAFDAAGNHSAQSTAASATTTDDIPPAVPGGLAASAASPTSVAVSWSASSDNVAVTGYDVYRDGVSVATLGPTVLSYQDTVASGSTHAYTVDAFDAAGNHSATPTPVSVTTSLTDSTPPSVPAGVTAAAVGSSSVTLAWNASTDNVGVTGYTVYRNGAVLATVGGTTTAYSDATVAQATTYAYTVDAFDAAGNHSAQSAPASVHVPGVPKFVQSAVGSTGTTVTSMTLTLGPVTQGDLLVGWFGQYNATGQVTVSDNVNGAWTRAASRAWHGGTTPGDLALYYRANSAAAGGLTITITAAAATYMQAGAAEYSGVATVNPLDQVVIATGTSTSADSGLTAPVAAGELVYGGMTATNGPGTLTGGTSQGVAFVKRAQNTSGSQGEEDILVGAAGQQNAGFTFPTSTQWFMVCAVFKPA